jgi:uncharacterized protein YeaO (DUF488 family)
MAADVRIKRIYDQASPEDGARVLVDRVWPRGVTKEAAALTVWLKEIAPSTALRKWFGHEPARFAEFRRRYLDEIRPTRRRSSTFGPTSRVVARRCSTPRTIRRTTTRSCLRIICAITPGGSMSVIRRESRRRAPRDRARRHRSLGGANAAAARVRRCA